MPGPRKIVAQIHELRRLMNSKDGNPTYSVIPTGANKIMRTAPDAAIAGQLANSEYQGVDVEFTLDAEGRIIDAKPVA